MSMHPSIRRLVAALSLIAASAGSTVAAQVPRPIPATSVTAKAQRDRALARIASAANGVYADLGARRDVSPADAQAALAPIRRMLQDWSRAYHVPLTTHTGAGGAGGVAEASKHVIVHDIGTDGTTRCNGAVEIGGQTCFLTGVVSGAGQLSCEYTCPDTPTKQ
jgi:hypothetical protein